MRVSVLTLSLLLAAAGAQAKEYGHYDPRRIVTLSQAANGQKLAALDTNYLDQLLGDLAIHAKTYPTQFDTPQDKERASKDAKFLSNILSVLTENDSQPDLLRRAAMANHMAHNLDVPGAAQKAGQYYQRLLAGAPNDPFLNYSYGSFLAETGQSQPAVPHLEKALAGGFDKAHYTLGLVYLTLGDVNKAVEQLESFKRAYPNDPNITKLIESVRSGQAKLMFNKGPS